MYIKFCRVFLEDKKDEVRENLPSKLSVELDGDGGKQTGGSVRLYRAACLLLALICLTLLLVVIVLSAKLQAGSTVCPESLGSVSAEKGRSSFPSAFSFTKPGHCRCQQCAAGWQAFDRSCYYFSTHRLSWDQSLQNCTDAGGSLAIVSSQNVQMFLTKEGRSHNWIGLRQMSDTWTWVNQTELQASHWADNPQDGQCGVLKGGKSPEKNWIRASCNAAAYFICQIEL